MPERTLLDTNSRLGVGDQILLIYKPSTLLGGYMLAPDGFPISTWPVLITLPSKNSRKIALRDSAFKKIRASGFAEPIGGQYVERDGVLMITARIIRNPVPWLVILGLIATVPLIGGAIAWAKDQWIRLDKAYLVERGATGEAERILLPNTPEIRQIAGEESQNILAGILEPLSGITRNIGLAGLGVAAAVVVLMIALK